MIKHIIQFYNNYKKQKTFHTMKLELIEEYDTINKKIKNQEIEEWEQDYFKGILISMKTQPSKESPHEILNSYISDFLKKQKYDALVLSTNYFYNNKYNILFITKEEYFSLNEIIFEKQALVLDTVSLRARNLILKVTEDVMLSTAIYNTYSYGGEA